MLVSTLLALSLSLGMVASPTDPAALLPADTLIYFGSTSVRDAWAAGRNSAMTKILSEPEVKSFLHEPLAAANQALKAGLEQMSGQIEQARSAAEGLGVEGDFNLEEFSFTLDSSEPTLGRTFFALTKLSLMGTESNPNPQVGLALGIEMLDASMHSQVRSLWSAIPAPESKGSHGGVDYLSRTIPGAPISLNLVFLDNLVVITTDVEALHGMIERHLGTATGPSLADSSEYRGMLEAAGGLIPGGSSHMIRVAPIAQLCRIGLAIASQTSKDIEPKQAALMMSLFDGLGFDAIQVSGGTSAVGADGLIYSTSVVSIDSSMPGLIARMAKSDVAVDTGLLKTIPGNSTSASISHLGGAAVDAYDFLMNVARQAAPDEVAMAEEQLAKYLGGASLRDDLLANPQGTLISYATPGQGMMGQSDNVMSMGLRDAPTFVAVLGKLLETVADETGMAVSLRESDHEGTPFYEIDLSGTPLAMMMSPGFALRDGQMVFSTNTKTLKSVLNGTSAKETSLADNERFAAFVRGLDKSGDVSNLSFTNMAESFGTQYSSLVSGVAMLPMGDLPVDFSKLPPKSVISKYLDESYSGGYTNSSGMTVSRSVSHFAMADFLPLAVIAAGVYAGKEMGLAAEELEVVVDPSEQAQNDLRELKASITVYKISMGGYPTTLVELLTPLDEFPQGAYPHAELPTDPWGNGYRFSMEQHPQKKRLMPKLWSLGPNGVDENGEGDDILRF